MNLTSVTNSNNINYMNNVSHQKGVEVYATASEFRAQTLYAIMQQASVFAALSIAKETNRLNGYEIFSTYDMHSIKAHYKSQTVQCQNERNSIQQSLQERTGYTVESKSDNTHPDKEKFSKDYQKAYIRMLTASAYNNSI